MKWCPGCETCETRERGTNLVEALASAHLRSQLLPIMHDNLKHHYHGPVSVKGIVFEDGEVWLRRNERDEWELPGGKMDRGEQPFATVARELHEELGFEVRVVKLVDAFLYTIPGSIDESNGVLVMSYLCELLGKSGGFELEGEAGAAEFKKFPLAEIPSLNVADFYRSAITKAKS